MTDIVERLRAAARHPYNQHGPQEWLTEAADEITRLRAALREWESAMNKLSMRVGLTAKDISDVLSPIMDNTRAALEQKA